MDNDLLIALFITLVGMTLLFLSLIVFYGLLNLVTRLFPDLSTAGETAAEGSEAVPHGKGVFHRIAAVARKLRKGSRQTRPLTDADRPGTQSEREQHVLLQAAAIAVALARAEVEREIAQPVFRPDKASNDQAPSAWWTLHHRRQLDTNLRRE